MIDKPIIRGGLISLSGICFVIAGVTMGGVLDYFVFFGGFVIALIGLKKVGTAVYNQISAKLK